MANTYPQGRQNVLPLFSAPSQNLYRAAVADCVRQIKARHKLTNTSLSEIIGCSAETISNAENENNDLSAVLFLRLWYHFGGEEVSPVTNLATGHCEQPKTIEDRFNDLAAELDQVRKMVGAA